MAGGRWSALARSVGAGLGVGPLLGRGPTAAGMAWAYRPGPRPFYLRPRRPRGVPGRGSAEGWGTGAPAPIGEWRRQPAGRAPGPVPLAASARRSATEAEEGSAPRGSGLCVADGRRGRGARVTD